MSLALVRTGHATDQRLALSPLDVFEYPIPIELAYAFRASVEPEDLRASLVRTLEQYPEYAGRLVREGTELVVVCNGRGAGFTTRHTALRIDALTEAEWAQVPMAEFFAPNAWLRCCGRDVPLLVVTHTRTACGGMVLGVQIAHALGDGESLVALVRDWARVHGGGAAGVAAMQRHEYGAHFRVREPAPDDPDRVPGFKRMSRLRLYWNVVKLAWNARSTASVVLAFSAAEVAQIKAAAACSGGNAVLAHVWQTFARLRPNRDDDTTAMFLVVGTRHLANGAVDAGYRGNAVWHVRAETTYQHVRTASLDAVAAVVVQAQASVGYDDVCVGMQWLANEQARGNLELGVVPDYELMRRDFFGTNLSRLPMYEADFGTGTPLWVTTKAPPVRWMIRVFPRPDGEGLNVHCTVPRRWRTLLASDEVHEQLHRYA